MPDRPPPDLPRGTKLLDIPLMQLPFWKRLFDQPPRVWITPGRQIILEYHADADEEAGHPELSLFVSPRKATKGMFGYSCIWPDGLVEQWYGPYGDPERDEHRPDASNF